jgi:hypothetical protein
MSLITCADCGRQISDASPACIHCGRPITIEGAQVSHTEASDNIGSRGPTPTTAVSGGGARVFGWFLLIAGLAAGAFALNMDTSVSTDDVSTYPLNLPSMRVNNIGLMNDKQNYLIATGVGTIVGVILIAAGGPRLVIAPIDNSPPQPSDRSVTSPRPVEPIRPRMCRRCGRDIPLDAANCSYCA